MSYAPANTTSIVVSISGVVQNPNTYSVSGLTLNFSPAPPTGTNNIGVLFLGVPASGVTTPGNTAYLTTTSFTATAGQTTFTPSGTYQVGYINVIRNGSQLAPADFTATNGTTVVLNNACVAGDVVVTQGYTLTSISNALPSTGGTVTGATTFNSTVSVNGASASGYTGFKNKLINGSLDIWQRATSFAAPANLAYTADRWFSIWGTANRTVSRQAGFSGSQYCLRVARNSGTTDSSYSGVVQIIETNNLYDLRGQTVTLSFAARRGLNYSSASNALLVTLGSGTVADQGSGTYWSPGWTGATVPINTSVTLGTTEQTFSIQAAIPANCLEIYVSFQYIATGTAGAADYFEITNVQLERGSSATSFEAVDYGRELIMCQRYLPAISGGGNYLGFGTGASTTLAYMTYTFPVQPRVAPTGITVSSASHFNVTDIVAANSPALTIGFGNAGLQTALISATLASGITSARPTSLVSTSASAQILWTGCEL
jgi:hypothetical protein